MSLENRVAELNRMNAAINSIVPELIKYYAIQEPKFKQNNELTKRSKAVLTKLWKNDTDKRISFYVESRQDWSTELVLHFKTFYSTGDHTCAYLEQRVIIWNADRAVEFKPVKMYSLEDIKTKIVEIANISEQIQELEGIKSAIFASVYPAIPRR